MKFKQIVLITLLGALPVAGFAQRHTPITTPERLFEEGKQLFIKKDYPAAARALADYLQQANPSPLHASQADYMLACIAYELKESDCISTLKSYLDQHADTPYRNRILALIGNAYFYQKEYEQAIDAFQQCDLDLLGDEERDEYTLHAAIAYIETGNLLSAYTLLSVVEACAPKYRNEVSFYKAYVDYALKRYDQALPAFENLREDVYYGIEVPYYIAEIKLTQRQYAEAEKEARNYLAGEPKSSRIIEMQRILGEACYGQGKYQEAQTELEAYVKATDKPTRNVLYQLGMCYFQQQAYQRACDLLGQTTFQSDALAQNAYLNMGLAYLQLQNKRQARMAFEQAAALNDDVSVKEQALYNYAVCIHETSYSPFAESVTVFERFLNEFPESAYMEKVNDYLVEVYMNTRSYDAALRSINKISQPGMRILEAKQTILLRMATEAFANADFVKTIDYADQSIALGQYNAQTKADAYYWRGEANYRLGQYDQAYHDFQRYLNLTLNRDNDMYKLALYNIGYTLFKQNNYADAGVWFARFINQRPSADPHIVADAYNRLGDCRFYARDFNAAQSNYAQAAAVNPSAADYALYQQAFVKGLQKDYSGKVADLNTLLNRYPNSSYTAAALYERGRAYVQMQDNQQAIASYTELVNKYPENAISRQGAGEIGLLYYQDDNYPEAIRAYKYVIEHYAGSDEARQAQRDLLSIYTDLNQIDTYAQYASTIRGGLSFDNAERDSLTYIAAEKVYMRGNTNEANTSFIRYLQQFPNGAFVLNANYYLGLIAYNNKDYPTAQAYLDKLIQYPDNKYAEEAMMINAEIAFNNKDYNRALTLYKLLNDKTASAERRLLAQTGILRSAYLTNNANEVTLAANTLLADTKVHPELANEARYYRAKMTLAVTPSQAVDDLQKLSSDTRNVYGAEAKYRLAQYYFDAGQTDEAEKILLDYIDISTPHAYWLARSFVLLADVYTKEGKTVEARQYLLSLQQNYQADNDIASMIETRLENLK